MFWGLKLSDGNRYHSLVDKSFHVSHAVLEPSHIPRLANSSELVEVHVVLHKIDYVICVLSATCVQHSLNLEISEGEELSVYVKTNPPGLSCNVHLTGFYVEESTDDQWEGSEEESIEDGLYDEEDLIYIEEDEDEDIAEYPSLSHLEHPSIREVVSDEEESDSKEDKIEGMPKGKRRLENNHEGEEEKPAAEAKRKKIEEKKSNMKKSGSKKLKKVTIQLPPMEDEKRKKKKAKNSIEKENKEKETTLGEPPVKKLQENYTKTFRDGLSIQDVTHGIGKVAKPGHKVSIRYRGTTTGPNPIKDDSDKPVTFTLGRGEVMTGLDRGIKGMRAGGTRIITIPSTLRRDTDSTSDIPRDAELVLNVNLLKVT